LTHSQPIRKSVIVKRQRQENPQVELELHLKNTNNTNDFVLSMNIKQLENMLTMEEGIYFENVIGQFQQKWNSVPFGEEMMGHFIRFCIKRQTLPPIFFKLIKNQAQERVLSFITSGDDLSKLPYQKQFHLLKRNLPLTVILLKIFGFNKRTWEEEMCVVFTTQDLEQFKERPAGVEGVKIQDVLQYSPFPIEIKRKLFNIFTSSAHPILGDFSVFFIMINLIIFYDPHDPEVMAIYDQYWTMLRRQLRPDTSMGVENLLYVIHSCLNILPAIAECLNPPR